MLVRLTPPAGSTYLGVDVGGTKVLVLANTADGRRTWTFPTGPECGPGQLMEHLRTVADELGDKRTIVAGIAVPGLTAPDGTITDCDVLPGIAGWNPLRAKEEVEFSACINDGDGALATMTHGERPQATLAAVGCGTGIAAALQLAGVRLRQFRPYSCELGYVPNGRQGTFDETGSGASLLRRLGVGPVEIKARLAAGDAATVAAVREAGEAFGAALATVINLVHPEKIGLYGGTLGYAGYLPAALAAVDRLAHPVLRADCQIAELAEPETVVARGALLAALTR
ncbi:MAG: ROK family protein [Bryobacterales bacterium]|nr:ROK family protein [Bryobacterales bacterium]